MTQSDSPDFEFDISDLEVEREESAASKEGNTASDHLESKGVAEPTQESGNESVKPDLRAEFDESDRELDVFEIDDLPSADGGLAAADEMSPVSDADTVAEASADPQPVQRIEEKPPVAPSRVLGEDDLGADVFAEIESELGSMGLDDVIDDLMEEVEDYEAGGFVDLDEDAAAEVSASSDGLFKMDDPDDSLRNSIDPNAEENEAVGESPAFPSPPPDFEIPADPDPSSREPARAAKPLDDAPVEASAGENTVEAESGATPPVQARAPEPAPVQNRDADLSNFEIPADPVPSPPRAERPAEPARRVSSPTSSTPDDSPQAESPVTASAPEVSQTVAQPEPPAKEVPPLEEVAMEAPTVSQEEIPDRGLEDPVSSAEGHEHVLFSAEDEPVLEEALSEAESVAAAEEVEEREIASDATAPEAEEVVAAEESEESEIVEPSTEEAVADVPIEDLPADSETESESIAAPQQQEEAEPTESEESDVEAVAAEDVEEDEDLSALLEAIEEEPSPAVDEDLSEVSEVEAEEEPSPVEAENLESEPEAPAMEEYEDEEDVSDLLASVLEEEVEEEAAIEPESQVLDEAEAVSDVDDPDAEVVGGEDETDPEVASQDAADGEEEELIDLPSPEALALDEPLDEQPEELSAAVPEVPGLVEVGEDLDEEDISSLIGADDEGDSTEAVASAPALDVLDDDEDEVVQLPVPEVPGLVEVSDEAEELEAPEEPKAKAPAPTAEELLMRAGGLLNGDSQKPADGASALLDVIDEDDDEIVSLPSPDELMSAGASEDDDEVVALPDPASLLTADGEAVAVIDDDEEDVPAPANVADRAGDLPPPPPAPVEIVDLEPPEEDATVEDTSEPIAPVEETAAPEDDEAIEDPFSGEISLDDFNEGFEELEIDDEESEEGEDDEISGEATDDEGAPKKEVAAKFVEMPKPSLLWRVTHSMSVAAGLVLIGLASVLAIWKQQIIEYYDGRDIDGSALLLEIEEIATHALSEFDEKGLYRMQWVDSEVRRVSENEIRLHAIVGARLRENLYRPVLESRLGERNGYDENQLLESLGYARDRFPEEIGNFPDRPWDRLYEISAKKEEVLPLRVTYGLKRDNEQSDWALSRIKVSGYNGDLEWPEGEPKYAFGENAYDINSLEFEKVYQDYAASAQNYVARIDRLKTREEDGILALKRENERQRERVRMALTEGSFFNGLAIVGEDASDSRDVQLVITEVRNEGGFVKGVVKLTGQEDVATKHFVGSLEFEKSMSGREQGYLSLRTVSIDAPAAEIAETPFFDAQNVSRMRLRADGFRLEGDSPDLSFRLTRNL